MPHTNDYSVVSNSGPLVSEPIITVSNLSKSFGNLEVLKGVDLTIGKGQMVAIVGRSGSGKSTLLRCMNGLESFQQGTICIGDITIGQNIDAQTRKALRRRVGMVFQSYNLFPHLTVKRNITLALTVSRKMARAQADEIAEEVLRSVGLIEKMDVFPEQLSGGQQQRVAIARSLALSPEVILFDEVTSALDPELTTEVLAVMERLAEGGMTMVLVTHEMNFARRCADVVVFMHEGKIREMGDPERQFSDPQTPEFRQFISSGL